MINSKLQRVADLIEKGHLADAEALLTSIPLPLKPVNQCVYYLLYAALYLKLKNATYGFEYIELARPLVFKTSREDLLGRLTSIEGGLALLQLE